eukprot:477102_1
MHDTLHDVQGCGCTRMRTGMGSSRGWWVSYSSSGSGSSGSSSKPAKRPTSKSMTPKNQPHSSASYKQELMDASLLLDNINEAVSMWDTQQSNTHSLQPQYNICYSVLHCPPLSSIITPNRNAKDRKSATRNPTHRHNATETESVTASARGNKT